MLKKSDIQALLDRLPEEFEAETFQRELAEIAELPIPQWQVDAAWEAFDRSRIVGTIPAEEAMERIEQCLEDLNTLKKH